MQEHPLAEAALLALRTREGLITTTRGRAIAMTASTLNPLDTSEQDDAAEADRLIASVNRSRRKRTASVFETGRILLKARTRMSFARFEATLKSHAMPFSLRTAQRLMKVASDKRLVALSKQLTTHGSSVLPESYRTLELISRLSDAELEAKLADGTIHPRMERKALEVSVPLEADDVEPADDEDDGEEAEAEGPGKRGKPRPRGKWAPAPNVEGRFDNILHWIAQLAADDCPTPDDIDGLGSIELMRLRQGFAKYLQRAIERLLSYREDYEERFATRVERLEAEADAEDTQDD